MLNKSNFFIGTLTVLSIALFFSCSRGSKEKQTEQSNNYNSAQFDSHKTGYDSSFYENGQLKMVGYLENGKREGLWRAYYPTGVKWSEGEFKNGKNHGTSKVYYQNGASRYEGFYIEGQRAGKWFFWNENSQLVKNIDYTSNPNGEELPLETANNK